MKCHLKLHIDVTLHYIILNGVHVPHGGSLEGEMC